MKISKELLRDRRLHRLAGGMLVLCAAAALVAWRMGVDGVMLKSAFDQTKDFLRERPWWLFAGLVILPGLPVPTSALLLLAGTVWGDRPVAACALSLAALAINMSWTYWAAAWPGRGLLEKLLAKSTLRIPELQENNHLRLILVLRLTPGVPLFLQN